MNFELNEEQKLIRNTVRDFAKNHIEPHAEEWDEKEEFPRELFSKLGDLGIMGVTIPEEYGGAGMDLMSAVIAVEELARVDWVIASVVSVSNSYRANTAAMPRRYFDLSTRDAPSRNTLS